MNLTTVIVLFIIVVCSSQGACFLKENKTVSVANIKSIPSLEGQWPFIASFMSIPEREFLKNRIFDDEHYICTGAIVGYRWVITSYQCIYPLLHNGNYTIVYTSSTKPLSGISHALKHYHLPINLFPYLPVGVDICLLELDEFIFNDNVTKSLDISMKKDLKEYDNMTIVGYSWFRDINDSTTLHNAKHSSISFLSIGNCEHKEYNFLICVGGDINEDEEDNVKYQFNDASPLITQINGDYMLTGMVVRPSTINNNNTRRLQATATFLPVWCDWIRYITKEEVVCK
uniref:Peptidase S1 domain-containing protein n=1 Tax=Panagrolaimus sp. PS1159 TaxID=55785 RepID=A0AC35GXM9_9BILA